MQAHGNIFPWAIFIHMNETITGKALKMVHITINGVTKSSGSLATFKGIDFGKGIGVVEQVDRVTHAKVHVYTNIGSFDAYMEID